MGLQKFLTNVIEAAGGIVIPLEYALCQVIVPESFKEMFQGREELQLAFDLEVAEENPQAEFVTFGSYLIEQMVAFVQGQTLSTVRFADIDPPSLHGALDKIRHFLSGETGVYALLSERAVTGVWAVFAFRVGFVSDEREEQYHRVWVDMNRGVLSTEMQRMQHLLSLADTQGLLSPIVSQIDMTTGLALAYAQVKEQAEGERLQRVNHKELAGEMKRIFDYYDELAKETLKRSERKGLSEQKKQELLDKTQSIGLEQQKQLEEMEGKFNIRIEVALDHGIVVMVPLLEYVVSITSRRVEKEITLHYNPFLKQFSVVTPISHVEARI